MLLVVAHRLLTMSCGRDFIYAQNGKIVEIGSHDDDDELMLLLLDLVGHYCDYARRAATETEEEEEDLLGCTIIRFR